MSEDSLTHGLLNNTDRNSADEAENIEGQVSKSHFKLNCVPFVS